MGSCVLEALKRLLWVVWLKIINQWTQTLDQRAETVNTREPVSCVTSCRFTCALSDWKWIWFMCIWIHFRVLLSFFKHIYVCFTQVLGDNRVVCTIKPKVIIPISSYSLQNCCSAVTLVYRSRTLNIQCLAKVFIPLHFFHVLLCCCLVNCFKLVFFYISLHSIHHIDKAKTELSQLCKLITNKKTEVHCISIHTLN